jgi:hypothetical protein
LTGKQMDEVTLNERKRGKSILRKLKKGTISE